MHFRYAFAELAAGKSPEDQTWLIHRKSTRYSDSLGALPRSYSEDQKEMVLRICLEANIVSIASSCKFPDWLGYLGLVLDHMYSAANTYKLVSSRWASQLKELVVSESPIYDSLNEIAEQNNLLINIQHLEACEQNIMYNNER